MTRSNLHGKMLVAALVGTIACPLHAQVPLPPPAGVTPPPRMAARVPYPAIEGEQSQKLSGRLFFSREQREQMDRARARGEFSPSGETVADPPPPMLNGFVKRSDGLTMIWVDGLARYNVRTDLTRKLEPQDVGGSGELMRVMAIGATAAEEATAKKRVAPHGTSLSGPRKFPALKRKDAAARRRQGK